MSRGEDRIIWLSGYLKRRFGGAVRKVALDAGFTCPNRDGTAGRGGCAWCDPGGSGPDGGRGIPWRERLASKGSEALAKGRPGVIAYFQAYSNTYGDAAKLREAFEGALVTPGVLGLAVGTRPDCLPPPVLDLLQSLSQRAFIWVEIGMQTRWDATLQAMNRGHTYAATEEACAALSALGIPFVLHLILGLPGESAAMMRESFGEAARLRPWGVKLHPLHVVKGALLEEVWRSGSLALLSLEEYASLAAVALETLPPETIIHRVTGERPEGLLLAPEWCRYKPGVRRAILQELARRGKDEG